MNIQDFITSHNSSVLEDRTIVATRKINRSLFGAASIEAPSLNITFADLKISKGSQNTLQKVADSIKMSGFFPLFENLAHYLHLQCKALNQLQSESIKISLLEICFTELEERINLFSYLVLNRVIYVHVLDKNPEYEVHFKWKNYFPNPTCKGIIDYQNTLIPIVNSKDIKNEYIKRFKKISNSDGTFGFEEHKLKMVGLLNEIGESVQCIKELLFLPKETLIYLTKYEIEDLVSWPSPYDQDIPLEKELRSYKECIMGLLTTAHSKGLGLMNISAVYRDYFDSLINSLEIKVFDSEKVFYAQQQYWQEINKSSEVARDLFIKASTGELSHHDFSKNYFHKIPDREKSPEEFIAQIFQGIYFGLTFKESAAYAQFATSLQLSKNWQTRCTYEARLHLDILWKKLQDSDEDLKSELIPYLVEQFSSKLAMILPINQIESCLQKILAIRSIYVKTKGIAVIEEFANSKIYALDMWNKAKKHFEELKREVLDLEKLMLECNKEIQKNLNVENHEELKQLIPQFVADISPYLNPLIQIPKILENFITTKDTAKRKISINLSDTIPNFFDVTFETIVKKIEEPIIHTPISLPEVEKVPLPVTVKTELVQPKKDEPEEIDRPVGTKVKNLLKFLIDRGWVLDRVNGSHAIFELDGETLPVPINKTHLAKGTHHAILKQEKEKNPT